jgi:lysylphosphatidylglycerol synthetase-like protein (DUF2156 family)
MEATTARPGYELWRPNREKAESKSAKALVTLLLLLSAALVLVVTIGGWTRLEGGPILNLPYAIIYVVFAYYVWRWQRGVLPVASALAIILAIFAAISAPAWFDRAKDGLTSPALPEELLGLITLLIVPLQIILIAVAMVAFNQEWHVEEERPIGGVQDVDDDEADDDGRPAKQAASSRKPAPRRTRTTRRRRTA